MGKWCHLIIVRPRVPYPNIILYVRLIRIDGKLKLPIEVRMCGVEPFPKKFQ